MSFEYARLALQAIWRTSLARSWAIGWSSPAIAIVCRRRTRTGCLPGGRDPSLGTSGGRRTDALTVRQPVLRDGQPCQIPRPTARRSATGIASSPSR